MRRSMASAMSEALCPDLAAGFFIPTWQALVGAALLASIGLIAFLYMVNRFFQNEQGVAWAKVELFEAFITVAIMIGVIALANAACGVNVGILFPSSDIADMNIYDASTYYLETFGDTMTTIMSTVYYFYVFYIDIPSTMTLTAWPMGLGTRIQPLAGAGATVKPPLINAMNMMTMAIIITKAQQFLVDFFTFAFMKYYLPLGVIMRAFAPTRRIGGTLIAIALGFMFVYPFLIILDGEMMIWPFNSFWEFVARAWTLSGEEGGIGGYTFGGDFGVPFKDFWDSARNYISSGWGLLNPASGFDVLSNFMSGLIGAAAFVVLFFIANTIAFAFLMGLFFPAFNTLILVTTIRYLSKTLGEEVDVTNLTRMV